MLRDPSPTAPLCPSCGAADPRPPDALGVQRCPACQVEFRPAIRVPIRRATVTVATPPNNDPRSLVTILVVIAVALGVAVALGDHKAAQRADPIAFTPPPPPAFDPKTLDLIANLGELQLTGPFAPVTLTHEVHLSQLSDGELFATGVLYTSGAAPVDGLRLEAVCRNLAGEIEQVQEAVLACERLAAEERCAWMVEAKLAGPVAELEFRTSGYPAIELGSMSTVELRSDRGDALRLDPERRELEVTTAAAMLLSPWASVTAYDGDAQVLGVSKTRWSEVLRPGEHQLAVTLPRPPDEVARYEVRLGGAVLDPPAPDQAPP